jgi:hypothetical protein
MSELHTSLTALHRELGEARSLDPDDRAMLETVLVDIQRLLEQPPASVAAEGERSDTLEGTAVRIEAGHPGLASAIRAVVDALAKAGI